MLKYWFRVTVKYMIILCRPKIVIKKVLLFFTKYKNGQIEHKFWRQKKSKKVTFIKTKSNQDR